MSSCTWYGVSIAQECYVSKLELFMVFSSFVYLCSVGLVLVRHGCDAAQWEVHDQWVCPAVCASRVHAPAAARLSCECRELCFFLIPGRNSLALLVSRTIE